MSGEIIEIGAGVSQWAVGDRVLSTFVPAHQTGQITQEMLAGSLGLPKNGVLATHRVFSASSLVATPTYMTHEQACTLPIAAVTAWMSLKGMRSLVEGDEKDQYVLLQGTGGVAIAGLQIAKAAGVKGKTLWHKRYKRK